MYLPPENRKKLRKLIVVADSSYRQVAAAAGWNGPSMVAHLVSGRKHSVKDNKALKIALHLGIDVNDLFVTKLSYEPIRPVATKKRTTPAKKAA